MVPQLWGETVKHAQNWLKRTYVLISGKAPGGETAKHAQNWLKGAYAVMSRNSIYVVITLVST